ncbi:hypothetical protein [Kitasatospora cineracea]|uniref:hypothetical protein n=1 Tax=Kitasatospora cineracea TaxID=88074 RepID=UPI00367407F4
MIGLQTRPTAADRPEAGPDPGPVTVAITGLLAPREFPTAREAGAAAWTILRAQPIGWCQAEAFREFLCDGLAERLDQFLQRASEVNLAFTMDGEPRLVTITRATA